MKLNKYKLAIPLLIPAVIAPVFSTSCSVFTDLMKGYTPSYEQISAYLTLEQAMNRWIEKANSYSSFIKEEYFWSSAQVSNTKTTRKILDDIEYVAEFTLNSSNMSYSKVANKDEHRISYKINCEIEQKLSFYLQKEYYGYGTIHYSIEWESKNLVFDCVIDHDDTLKKDFWLIKPAKYDFTLGEWIDYLDGDEYIAFNARCIYESYNKEGIQMYGYEATEAAIMDKHLSYTAELGDILSYFFCFWSYYLDDCKLK